MTVLNANLECSLVFHQWIPLFLMVRNNIPQQTLDGMYITYCLSPRLWLLINRLPLQGLTNTAGFSLGRQVNVKAANLSIQLTTILDVSTSCGAIKHKTASGRDHSRVPTYTTS